MKQIKNDTLENNVIDLLNLYPHKFPKLSDLSKMNNYPEIYDLLRLLEKKPHLRELACQMLLEDDAC